LDYLDHNPSSAAAQSSLHGIGISIDKFYSKANPGILIPSNNFPDVEVDDHNLTNY